MSSDSESDDDKGNQVRVSLKLASTVSDRSLEVPSDPIAVPADIGRKGLSAVINHLLGRKTKNNKDSDDSDSDDGSDDDDSDDAEKLVALNFEFILSGTNNKLLRKGVEKEARQHGLSLENAIIITYFPASNEPELSDEHESLPDWISCLSLINTNPNKEEEGEEAAFVCSGCYDGTLHLFKDDSNNSDGESSGLVKLDTAVVSSGPIKCCDTTALTDDDNGRSIVYIATACLDHTMQIHTYDINNSSSSSRKSNKLSLYGQCSQDGLSCPMTSLDFAPTSSSTSNNGDKLLLASGDGHGCICIWDILGSPDSNAADEITTKKMKTSKSSSKSIKSILPQVSMVSSHTQTVSGLSWGNHHTDAKTSNLTHLISGSWDHSIKLWDVLRQDCLLTLNGSRVVSCLDTSYHSEGVVATGHPDCTIRLWDVRSSNDSNKPSSLVTTDNTFRPSHRAWVSCVNWSKTNPYHLLSTSHDATIKLWDIRSSSPLHTLRVFPKDEKALALVWNADNGTIYAGGTDCTIKQVQL